MGNKYPAAFIRGGTSKALVFHERDLPAERSERDAIFLSVMGTPDRYGRQLNGMGGGLSSLSKVCIVGPSSRDDADVDYTFVQVQIGEARCEYSGNCGNMSSAIGPFAVDEGLVPAPPDGDTCIRIHNTNTRKIIHSTFPVVGGRSVERGSLAIPGVDGTAAPVRLDFLSPGGASTGHLLPTGHVVDVLHSETFGSLRVSMVDAANACVFLDASSVGLKGNESPDEIGANLTLMHALEDIRQKASVAMGICASLEEARSKRFIPFVTLISPAQGARTLAGDVVAAGDADMVVRMLSNGQAHRALPLTGSLCTAVAAHITGSIPNLARSAGDSNALRLSMPSGVLTVDAHVGLEDGAWRAERGSFFRTTRRLFDGFVYAGEL